MSTPPNSLFPIHASDSQFVFCSPFSFLSSTKKTIRSQMAYRIAPFVFGLLPLTVLLGCSKQPVPAQEKQRSPSIDVSVSPASIRFGKVAAASEHKAQFTLENHGLSDLIIQKVSPTCDCLSIKLESNQLQAGHSVSGEAVLDLTHDPKFAGDLMPSAKFTITGFGELELRVYAQVEFKPN